MVRVVERRIEASEQVVFGSGVVEPVDPRSWGAWVTAFRADGVSVELIRARPFRYTASCPTGTDAPLVMLAVGAGRLHGLSVDGGFEAPAGRALLGDVSRPVTLWATEDVRLLRVAVERAEVPPHRTLDEGMPLSVLDASPVLQASIAFASTLVRSSREEGADDETTVARTMIALQLGLLEESTRQRREHVAEADRRTRIEAHIDAHLDDPDLGPTTIARAFGLSLRSVHAAFDGSGSTVAATIRRRRVEAVQRELRSERSMPRLTDLAEAHGFRNRTHLSRSFRGVTGCVPRAWWEAQRRSRE